MSGKILGFRKLDVGWVDSWQIRDKKDVHPSHATKVAALGDKVPCVGLEALEKWCKERKHKEVHFTWQNLRNQLLDEIFVWAHGQAEAKKE